jgi:hypothetical protein
MLACLLSLLSCQRNAESANDQAKSASAGSSTAAAEQPPVVQTVTIPEGTEVQVRLVDALGSARNQSGDKFLATLDQPIVVNNWVAVPKGAKVTGRVISAQPSGHLKTPAELALTLTSIEVDGGAHDLTTSNYVRRGTSHAKRNAAWIGGGAAGGALLGGLIGGKKGAAIGAGAGAGGGTATAYATGKKDVVLPAETRLTFKLKQPLTIAGVA